jgi:hypothetical protein
MTLRPTIYAFATIAALAAPAFADDMPLNPAVTQATIEATICSPGWTKTVRPSPRYTSRIKIKLIRELEIPEELLVDFELDHRIPLALGGAPSEPRNLELQPWDEAGEKDRIETCLSRAVCAGTRRASACGKIGARLGRLANDRLVPPPRRISRTH